MLQRYVSGRVAAWAALASVSGCGTFLLPPSDPSARDAIEDGNADASGLRTIGVPRGEPNGSFAQSIPVIFNNEGQATLRGSIQSIGDIDVFDLGPLAAGDRLVIDVNASEGILDSSIAVFDAAQRLFMENDDRGGRTRGLDALVDQVVRHGSDHYYLAVAAAAFAGSGAERVGRYRVAIDVIPGGEVPPPVRQALVLDFDGGTVDAPSIPVSFVAPFDAERVSLCCAAGWRAEGLSEIEAFDAAKLSPLYAERTADLKTRIIAVVRENFAPFGVDISTSDDPAPQGPFSTVFFGGGNPVAFGIAEAIDHYNGNPEDVVVVFTASFTPEVFSFPPSVEELGVAIGNVASHEAGHILGLNHVNNRRDLMDAISPADTLLADQEFRTSPLSEQIVPIGTQDGVLLLMETLGPN